jgi:DNA invertase Pin-like site-specific DNA recombinase
MKVAIYARVSTSKQDNGNQLIQLREFAAKQKWQVVTKYVDTVSGSGKKLATLLQLLPSAALAARNPAQRSAAEAAPHPASAF